MMVGEGGGVGEKRRRSDAEYDTDNEKAAAAYGRMTNDANYGMW